MSFFGKNIKKIRKIKGWSQQAFSDIFELKRATVGAYEEGRSEPKIATIIKVANYFSIEIGDFLTRELTVNELLNFKIDLSQANRLEHGKVFNEVTFIDAYQRENFIKEINGEGAFNFPKINLPIEEEGTWVAIENNSLEMCGGSLGLGIKDILIGKQFHEIDTITFGLYVVITDDFLLRNVESLNETTIKISTIHEAIEDEIIPVDKIKGLFKIIYRFGKLKEIKQNDRKIIDLQNQINEIIKKISK